MMKLKFDFEGRCEDLGRVLRCLCCCHLPAPIGRVAKYVYKGCSFTTTTEGKIMFQANNDDVPGTLDVAIQFTHKGKPVKVDGVPTLEASDPSVVDKIEVLGITDGGLLTAKVHLTDVAGASNLTLTADVDTTDGVKTKTFVDVVSVLPPEADAAAFTFGSITPDEPAGGGTTPPGPGDAP